MRVRDKKEADWWIFFSVVSLLGIGIIMVFSSSQYVAQFSPFNDSLFFLKRQCVNAAVGLAGMFFFYKFKYSYLKKLAPLGFILVIVLLLGAFFFGVVIKGAGRWFLGLQPSELCKLALVIMLAKVLSENLHKIKDFKEGFLPPFILMAVSCVLVLLGKDLGSMMIIAATALLLMFCAGVSGSHLIKLCAAGAAGLAALIVFEPYRMKRFLAFLNPWADPLGDGFQTLQSLFAIGSGGLSGVGLGAGGSKLYYLPERQTDFIFSVLAEEFGFIGCALVLALFALFVWRGLNVAVKTQDNFGSLLALGLTCMIGVQAIVNIGVVTGLLPVTGITLPFISYGGTSLVVSLAAVGILLNISQYAKWK